MFGLTSMSMERTILRSKTELTNYEPNSVEKVKIGWIGAGFIGQVAHLVNYLEIPGAEVVGLSELRAELGKEVCKRYGISQYYEDHRELLDNPEIEAIVAIVRRNHTAPLTWDILSADKHVFTEKPMAQTLDQAERLANLAEKNNLLYSVGFMRRHDQGVQETKRLINELISSNELGSILFARFYLSAGGDYCNIDGFIQTEEEKPTHKIWPTTPPWIPKKLESEYEHFLNVCSHDLNLIRFLFNKRPSIKHVDYRSKLGSVVVMDFGEFSGVFEWADTSQNRWEEGVDIYFEKGRLHLELPPAFLRNYPSKLEIYKDNGKEPGKLYSPTFDWTWSFRRQDEAFVNDVANKTRPIANGLDSVEDMRFLEDIWQHIC